MVRAPFECLLYAKPKLTFFFNFRLAELAKNLKVDLVGSLIMFNRELVFYLKYDLELAVKR